MHLNDTLAIVIVLLLVFLLIIHPMKEGVTSGYPRERCPAGYSWWPEYGECVPSVPTQLVRSGLAL